MNVKTVHRVVTAVVVLFTLYLAVTGTLIQLVDMRSLATGSDPMDPNVQAMREAFDGPTDFKVIESRDYLARPLPAALNLPAAFERVTTAAIRDANGGGLAYVEVRMAGDRPVGQVKVGQQVIRYDANTGRLIGPVAVSRDSERPASLRNDVKHLHRMTTFGDWALWINIVVSAALIVLIVTGTIMYVRMIRGRARGGRRNPFWYATDWWRTLHRATSLVAGVFIAVVALSGAWLAVESVTLSLNLAAMQRTLPPGAPRPTSAPHVEPRPLDPVLIPAMLNRTMASSRGVFEGPMRVVRLRNFGTMAQGVVVTGEPIARQIAFDATSGRRVSLTEPGYPRVLLPFGWQAHQTAKSIHRGDFFGLTGRMMDLLSGLALTYLSVSGIVMYYRLWSRRRQRGKKALVWM